MESGDALLIILEKIRVKRAEITRLESKISDMSSLEANLKFQLEESVLCVSHLKKDINTRFGDGKQALQNKYHEIQEITSSYEEINGIKENLQKQLWSCKNELSSLREDENVLRFAYFSTGNNPEQEEQDTKDKKEYTDTTSMENLSHLSLNTNEEEGSESLSLNLARSKLEIESLKREIGELLELRRIDRNAMKEMEDINKTLKDDVSRLQMSLDTVKSQYTKEDFEILQRSYVLLMDQVGDDTRKALDEAKKVKEEANKQRLSHFNAMEAAAEELSIKTAEVVNLREECSKIPLLQEEISKQRETIATLRADIQGATTTTSALTDKLRKARLDEAAQCEAHRDHMQQAEVARASLQRTIHELQVQVHSLKAEVEKRESMFLTYKDAMNQQLSGLRREIQEAKDALDAAEARQSVQAEREKQWMCELNSFCRQNDSNFSKLKALNSSPTNQMMDEEGLTSNSDDDSVDSDSSASRSAASPGMSASRWGNGIVAKTTAELQLESLQRQHCEIQRREAQIQRFVEDMQRLLTGTLPVESMSAVYATTIATAVVGTSEFI